MKIWRGTEPELVQYVDHMGCDDAVCDAARVSMNKTADLYTVVQNHKLIQYLAKHNHWSPFSHCQMKLRFKAPIFIARQLMKHQIGFAWNEVSRRYVDEPPEFFVPSKFRMRADNVKQGSSDEPCIGAEIEGDFWIDHFYNCADEYKHMIEVLKMCPEQARAFLPQAMMTEWIWTGSLYAWARMYNLRSDSHAQKEVQFYASRVAEEMTKYFPMSWNALTNE